MDMDDYQHGSHVASDAATAAVSGANPLAALGMTAVTAGIEGFMKQREMVAQHKFSTMEQDHAYDLGQLAQRNAAKNTVEGLKMAGLSPALAGGSSGYAPSPTISAPSKPNASGISLKLAEAANLQMIQSQIDLNESQAEKNRAEAGFVGERTTTQGITNARMTQEDMAARDLVSTQITSLLDSPAVKENKELEAALGAMLEASNKAKFNLGTLRANSDFIKLLADGNRTAIEKVRANYENVMLDWYLQNNKFELDVNEVKSRIAKNSADVLRASAEMALAYSNIDLNSAKAQDLLASAADHMANAGLKYSKDYVAQWKSGDYAALGINAAMSVISGLSSGAGYGAGVGVAGKVAGRAASIGVKNGGKAVSNTAHQAGKRLSNLKVGATKPPFEIVKVKHKNGLVYNQPVLKRNKKFPQSD